MTTAVPTALVTGGNRGLGQQVCRDLAQSGKQVWLTSRGSDGKAVAEAMASEGLSVKFHPLDVTDPASIAALVASLVEHEVTLNVLVNNAGIAMEGFNAELARQTVAVNTLGPLHLTDALLPHIAETGKVVMVSSGMGELSSLSHTLQDAFLAKDLTREALVALMARFVDDVAGGRHIAAGWPSSAYRVSKAGLNALTRVLANDPVVVERKIRVNAVCPGWVQTDMGGQTATSTVAEGAAGIVWAAGLGSSGGFYRNEQPIRW